MQTAPSSARTSCHRSVELKITFGIDDDDDKTTTLFLCKILLLHIWEIKWKFHVPICPLMVLAVAICWIGRNFHHYSLQFSLSFLPLQRPSNYTADPFRFYYFLFNFKDVYYSFGSVVYWYLLRHSMIIIWLLFPSPNRILFQRRLFHVIRFKKIYTLWDCWFVSFWMENHILQLK